MNEQEITETFSAADTRKPEVATWFAPENADARKAFARAMRGKRHRFEVLLECWTLFLDGWSMLK